MSKQKFKVGDRVRIVKACVPLPFGNIGEIIEVDDSCTNGNLPYRVEIECTGFRPLIWCYEVEHIKKKHPVVVITTDGKTTTATMRKGKKVIKTATATCSDKDTFDFAEGARVAFERLQGREPFANAGKKPEYYSGKVVCIKENTLKSWTVGKVYPISNGKINDDDGIDYYYIACIDDLNKRMEGKFAELVED